MVQNIMDPLDHGALIFFLGVTIVPHHIRMFFEVAAEHGVERGDSL